MSRRCLNLPHFLLSISLYALQEWLLPCKELYDLHGTEEFLKELGAFIRPHHTARTKLKHLLHDHRLGGGCYYEERETCERARSQVCQEQG